jgi:hypothetical protein
MWFYKSKAKYQSKSSTPKKESTAKRDKGRTIKEFLEFTENKELKDNPCELLIIDFLSSDYFYVACGKLATTVADLYFQTRSLVRYDDGTPYLDMNKKTFSKVTSILLDNKYRLRIWDFKELTGWICLADVTPGNTLPLLTLLGSESSSAESECIAAIKLSESEIGKIGISLLNMNAKLIEVADLRINFIAR